ncbi:hypothetical protein BJ742DRAFT_782735 [Cladochytrium replicatum]|nr:hypothetical protein BJ742DRAFT_782735 [Cladochytrium replicatum]
MFTFVISVLVPNINALPVSFCASSAAASLYLNGSSDPAAIAKFYSLGGINLKSNSELSKQLAAIFESELGVSSTRSYIFFNDFEASDIGYGGKTFAG